MEIRLQGKIPFCHDPIESFFHMCENFSAYLDLIYFMPGNTMIDYSVPNVHINHATIKFILSLLTIMGQAIMTLLCLCSLLQ